MPKYLIRETNDIASLQNLTAVNEVIVVSNVSDVSGTTPLFNNGTINVNSGAALGGLIQTDSENGKLIFVDGATNTVESLETNGTGNKGIGVDWGGVSGYVFSPVNPQTLTEKAQMHVINDFTSLPLIDVSSGTYEGIAVNGSYGFGTRAGTATIKGDDSILPNVTKAFEITDNSTHLLGKELIWSCDDETKLVLNSKSGRSITVTGRECGKVNLSCKIRYKGKDIKTVTRSIKAGPNPTVTVDTSNIYDNPSDPYNIGGIGDYRDITVTMDKDCKNSRIEWIYDSSKLQLTQKSGSYPTFTYRFTTIAAGNDTLKFNYISDNVTENDCWTQAISIADNKRLTKFEVTPSMFSGKVSPAITENIPCEAGTVDFVGNLPSNDDLHWSYIETNRYVKVIAVSLNGNKLIVSGKGKSFGVQPHSATFYVYCNNGKNGAEIRSNDLTLRALP